VIKNMANTIVVSGGQAIVTIEQDKDAYKPYRFGLTDILPSGDVLKKVDWVTTAGITLTDPDFDGADIVVWISGGTPLTWYTCTASYETQAGVKDQVVLRVYIQEDVELADDLGSALFPNKFATVAQLRRDRLVLSAQSHFSGVTLTGPYIWDKLRAAEAEVARTLRVKFQPTAFFPQQPTQEEIDALGGMPWELDEGYDYDPAMFDEDRWGLFQTHSSPLIEVKSIRFAYPAYGSATFDIPNEWIQLDRKYGHVRIVPLSTAVVAQLTPMLLQLVAAGRTIPNMVRITYVAGLKNASADYPQLVDAVKKLAVLKIIEDGFLPQSGSISGDGLSQSMSVDMSKYEETVDRILNGAPGSNGGLRAAIHGITMGVM
jgi:hypothetical protein